MEAIKPLKSGAPEGHNTFGGLIRNRQGAGKATNQTANPQPSKDNTTVDTDLLIEQVTVVADSIAAALHLANNDTDRSILLSVFLWSLLETGTNLDNENTAEDNILDLFEQTGTILTLLTPAASDDEAGEQL